MLVGRSREQGVVQHLLAAVRVGGSGVLVLVGDPGIGKSALLADVAASAAGMQVLRVDGAVPEQEVSFGGLHQLCAPLAGLLDRLAPPQQEALGVALRTRAGASPDRFAVGVAVLGLLSGAAEDAPVLVLVDDAHLLDRPSADAVVFAARRLVNDRVAVLIAMRPAEQSPFTTSTLPELTVPGLDLDAARRLVGPTLAAGSRADLLPDLHRVTAGNPLALLELAGRPEVRRSLVAGAPVLLDAGLQAAFAGRAGELPSATQDVLLLIAAGSRDLAPAARAAEALGWRLEDLAPAERAGLVELGDGSARFRHPLVRAAVYGAADPARRRMVHRALAAALAGPAPAPHDDLRAWHLAEASVGPDESVALALAGAALGAEERGAHAVAASLLERAAGLSPLPGDRTARELTAAEQHWLAGRPRRATGLLDHVLLTASADQQVRVSELRGAIEARCGSLPAARDTLLAGAEAARDPGRSVLLLADVVHVCFYLGDIATAVRAADRIVALVDTSTARRVRAVGLMAAGVAHVLAGHGDSGAALVRSGMASAPEGADVDDRLRVQWTVLGPLFLREGRGARDRLGRTVTRLRDRAAATQLPVLLMMIARDDATTDRWADAEAGYLEAVRLAEELGQTTDLALSLAGLAWLQARRGEDERAREAAERAAAIGERHEVHLARAWAASALGDLEAGAGRSQEAGRHYQALTDLLEALGVADPDLSPAPELVETLARLGRPAQARELAAAHLRLATDKGQPWSLARAHRAVVTGGDGDLDVHLEAALGYHAQTPDVFERARTQLAFGARLRRAARRSDARPLLREALETFDLLGARPWADQAAAELRASGETVRRRDLSVVEQLTPQERQTAQLLAEGRTTRQAAAALFLSPKTVEFHLRNVYIKLGIHSRDELARAMGY